MTDALIQVAETVATPIQLVRTADVQQWLETLPETARLWAERAGFKGKAGQVAWLPGAGGLPERVVVGWDGRDNLSTLGALPLTLPEGDYQLLAAASALQLLGWAPTSSIAIDP